MLSLHIYAALVQERHRDFLAQAETDRRKRRARSRRLWHRTWAAWQKWYGRPRNGAGAAVLIRPVRADLVRREPGALEYEITLEPAE